MKSFLSSRTIDLEKMTDSLKTQCENPDLRQISFRNSIPREDLFFDPEFMFRNERLRIWFVDLPPFLEKLKFKPRDYFLALSIFDRSLKLAKFPRSYLELLAWASIDLAAQVSFDRVDYGIVKSSLDSVSDEVGLEVDNLKNFVEENLELEIKIVLVVDLVGEILKSVQSRMLEGNKNLIFQENIEDSQLIQEILICACSEYEIRRFAVETAAVAVFRVWQKSLGNGLKLENLEFGVEILDQEEVSECADLIWASYTQKKI